MSQDKPLYLLETVGSHTHHPCSAWSIRRALLLEMLLVSYLPGLQLSLLVVTQSLSLSENNYSAYPGKTLIFTWKPLNCTLSHIMYTKPEINKWCCSTSQAFLLWLHCVFILPCAVCSVGGLRFPQHTVISFLSCFPLFIIGVPSWSAPRVLCQSEESKPKKKQIKKERTAMHWWRVSASRQALLDVNLQTETPESGVSIWKRLKLPTRELPVLPSPLLCQEMLQSGRRALWWEGTSLWSAYALEWKNLFLN